MNVAAVYASEKKRVVHLELEMCKTFYSNFVLSTYLRGR